MMPFRSVNRCPRVIGDRGVEGRMPDGDARRSRHDPPDVLISVPHFDPKGQAGGDVVQVRVRQLAQKLVHAEIGIRRRAPEAFALLAELFEEAERVELAVIRCVAAHAERNQNMAPLKVITSY